MHRIVVPYRREETLRAILAKYRLQLVDALSTACAIDVNGDFELDVEFLDIPQNVMAKTADVLRYVDNHGRRCLNIPETLSLGLVMTDKVLICLGQRHQGPCMEHALVTIHKEARFTGFYGPWNKGRHLIPVTTTPDILA
ncbi:hypothetical protein K8R03_03870 [Candidatus Kaiserbacteria bacterium]|nr:hypothetical protein [Candidatus Kaiserbacteria bacterium]